MEKKTIDINIEVYKLIERYRNSFGEDYNDILKRILNSLERLERSEKEGFKVVHETPNVLRQKGLFWKGLMLQNGLKLRGQYKGELHEAEVKNGRIVFRGQEFTSPSAASTLAAGVNISGWKFWEYFDEKAKSWKLLGTLRKNKK